MTETRALLLTDVVDSTKLAEQLGDAAMAALWARHDRVARDLLPVHRGREIDKTDGFLMLFEAAHDAVAYAVAYHRAIGALGLKARAGLHVGPVILTENSPADVALGAKPLEVDGLAKPTAARIMGLATGGQTLLSEDARAALGQTSLRIESHGHWRMKGVSEPIELFEIGDDDAPFTPPPDGAKVYRVVLQGDLWLPVQQVKHSLPAERDAFVGRQADLVALARHLDGGARLVSVLGIGGTGKTRLVVRYGWTWLGDYPGGVWFCDLSEARSVEGICSAVATALDVPLGKDDPVVQLGHAIAGHGACLVVLDNFEQVSHHAAETVGRWLDRARDTQFVVTTREVLGLPGETTLALAPLVGEDSVALFVARARQAKQDFVPDDTASLRALVTLLDGLPLAIELAAARVRLMPPKTLLERMSQRFKLLSSTGGRHTRQATLRGALDWSWDLLSADERAALAQLSVFQGGFTLDAAEGVLALSELWPMDAVQALVDKSLVRQVSDDRFDLLVSVQEYAAEMLEAQQQRADAEARHAAWFAQLGSDEALEALSTHGGVPRRRALARELENLVCACQRSITHGAAGPAVALLRAAWEVLVLRGPVSREADLAERVGGMVGLSPAVRAEAGALLAAAQHMMGHADDARSRWEASLALAREVGDRRFEGVCLGGLGVVRQHQGRMDEAGACFDAALQIHREVGDRRSECNGLLNLGLLHIDQGHGAEARAHFDAALAVSRATGNRHEEGRALGSLASLHRIQGRSDDARAHYEAALVIHREVGNRRSESIVLGNLGNLNVAQGRLEEARANLEAAVAVHREVGDRRIEGPQLTNLGLAHLAAGRLDEARACFEAALVIQRECGLRRAEGHALAGLGHLHRRLDRWHEALAHFEAALAIHQEVGDRHNEGHAQACIGYLHLKQGRLDVARVHLAEGERVLREVEDPTEIATVLCSRAALEAQAGFPDAARAALAEAQGFAEQVGAAPGTDLAASLAEARAAVEAR